MKALFSLLVLFATGSGYAQSNLAACKGSDVFQWNKCFGSWTAPNEDKYVGEFKDGKFHDHSNNFNV